MLQLFTKVKNREKVKKSILKEMHVCTFTFTGRGKSQSSLKYREISRPLTEPTCISLSLRAFFLNKSLEKIV
jgi:hypothetical protein